MERILIQREEHEKEIEYLGLEKELKQNRAERKLKRKQF